MKELCCFGSISIALLVSKTKHFPSQYSLPQSIPYCMMPPCNCCTSLNPSRFRSVENFSQRTPPVQYVTIFFVLRCFIDSIVFGISLKFSIANVIAFLNLPILYSCSFLSFIDNFLKLCSSVLLSLNIRFLNRLSFFIVILNFCIFSSFPERFPLMPSSARRIVPFNFKEEQRMYNLFFSSSLSSS